MKLPEEWLSGKKVLTADQVKKLPVGTTICFHQCYGKLRFSTASCTGVGMQV